MGVLPYKSFHGHTSILQWCIDRQVDRILAFTSIIFMNQNRMFCDVRASRVPWKSKIFSQIILHMRFKSLHSTLTVWYNSSFWRVLVSERLNKCISLYVSRDYQWRHVSKHFSAMYTTQLYLQTNSLMKGSEGIGSNYTSEPNWLFHQNKE